MDVFYFQGALVNKFKCPECTQYMTAPISQCNKGRNICGTCKEKVTVCQCCQEPFVARNHDLERLCETTDIPCTNIVFGCPEIKTVNKLNEHTRVCPYRMYECLAGKRKGCKWRGGKNLLSSHVQEKHREVAWMNQQRFIIVQNLKLPQEIWDCQLLQAHGEIFWFHQHYSAADKTVYTAVQYIGTAEIAKKFLYQITYGSPISPEKVSMSCVCQVDSEDLETVLKRENCASVKFGKLNVLIHDFRLKFKVKVKKID